MAIFERRHYILSIALSISVLLETLALTYMQESGPTFYYSSSIIYFICGLAICIIPIMPINTKGRSIRANRILNKTIPYLTYLFLIAIVCYQMVWLFSLYQNVTINKEWADMLPSIRLACQRFLEGKTVYSKAPEIWNKAIIPYLPMMWIPFLPAMIWRFDMRWITFIVQSLGLVVSFAPIINRKKLIPFIPFLIGGIGLFLLHNFLIFKEPTYWALTEEGVVAGFYLFLSFVLLRKNYWLIGLAITCCTLSRYSLLFWIPIYFAFVLFTRPRSDFWKLLLSYCTSMALLFILPFFIQDPQYFISIPIGYAQFIPAFWQHYRLDEHLYYNVGLFKFFTFSNLTAMSILEVCTSFLAPLLFILAFLHLRKRLTLNEKYISFCSLKISLVFFFSFIQMPFFYIFVPITLISYIVLFDYIVREKSEISFSALTV